MLEFNITNQSLRRADRFDAATDSVDYLKATFNFLTADWEGLGKTAIFRSGTDRYKVTINSAGECTVPHEVLESISEGSLQGKRSDKFFVTVYGALGTQRVTTNELRVDLSASGYGEAVNTTDPTPDIYAQFIADVKADNDKTVAEVAEITERTEAAATRVNAAEERIRTDYANAVRGTASGEIIRVDNVSPIEHKVKVKARGKNLLPLGTINFTKNKNVALAPSIPAGTYTISTLITSNDTDGELSSVSINSGSEVLKYIPLKRGERISSTFTVNKPITNIDFCAAYNYSLGVGDTAEWADIQLEEGDTATEYTPYVDPTTVTFKRCGKNLLDIKAKSTVSAGITYTVNEDGSVTANGTATDTSTLILDPAFVFKPNVSYTLTGCPLGGGTTTYRLDDTNKNADDGNGGTVTYGAETTNSIRIRIAKGATVSNLKFYPMLVCNGDSGDFEKYNGTAYIPNADGAVDGVYSVAPTMTLLTDTEGVTIEAEYNVDINTVFDRINELLVLLLNGGA